MFDRAWLLTWTAYGNWLPGDPRGFVGFHPDDDGERIIHNLPATPFDRDVDWMYRHAKSVQKYETVCFTDVQAAAMVEQFVETAAFRKWLLPAIAVMTNHVHLVVLVPGDPEPEKLLHDFKSYGSRRLNRLFGKQEWWTSSGSTRILPDERAIRSAVRYVRDQVRPLVVQIDEAWLPGEPRQL